MSENGLIHIVDDDRAVRDGLGFLLGSLGLEIATHTSALAFLDALDATAPVGCILADVRMPGMSGLELLDELQKRNCPLPVIMITGHGDVPMAVKAMRAGALDFFEKPVQGMALIDRIKEALDLSRTRASEAGDRAEIASKIDSLTAREVEVARAVVRGLQNKQIAVELGISSKTVEIHRHNAMSKLTATSTADMVRRLVAAGWGETQGKTPKPHGFPPIPRHMPRTQSLAEPQERISQMDTTRRGFLGAIGQVTIGAAASVAGAGQSASAEGTDVPHWGMVVDLRKCIGCQACTVACIMENAVPEDAFRTHVSVYELVKDGQDPAMVMLPRLCNHCDDPPCLPVCPVEATFKAETGEVLVDASKCVGCAYCVQACPYDARFINHETQVADKCTFCFHRTQAGLLPACVETCVGGARNFGDLNDPESEVSKMLRDNEVSVLRPEMHTNPNVYYIGLDDVLDGRVAGEAAYHPEMADTVHTHGEGL